MRPTKNNRLMIKCHALLSRWRIKRNALGLMEWHGWTPSNNTEWRQFPIIRAHRSQQAAGATHEHKHDLCVFGGLHTSVVFVLRVSPVCSRCFAQLVFWVSSPKVDLPANSFGQAVNPAHLNNNKSGQPSMHDWLPPELISRRAFVVFLTVYRWMMLAWAWDSLWSIA